MVLLGISFALALPLVAPAEPPFALVALGVQGGVATGNLTSLLVGKRGQETYLAIDAGTLVDGIAIAFKDEHATDVLRNRVRGYAITHAHFDHVAGLVVATTDDVPKPLYALPPTIDALRDHAFNWTLWPNMGDAGKAPALGRLRYVAMQGQVPVEGTGLTLEAFPLSHSGAVSTAFLVSDGNYALLHLGDTGTDAHEKTDRLAKLWERVAPLVRDGKLRAIVIEASYPDARPVHELYGHLTPKLVKAELARLAVMVRPEAPAAALEGVTVVVTHLKPSFTAHEPRDTIVRELGARIHGARVIVPRQGERFAL